MVPGARCAVLAGVLVAATGAAPAMDEDSGATEIGPLVTVAGDSGIPFGLPSGLAAQGGSSGVYVGERDGWVRRINPGGSITTVAGNGMGETSGDGGPAVEAGLESVAGIALGAFDIYIADPVAHRVRHVDGLGTINTIAGTGEEGISGDGGYGDNAQLRSPEDVAVGREGELYIVDSEANQVRMVSSQRIISTVAGTGEPGVGGDGGPASEAQLRSPQHIAVGPDGEFYIVDSPARRPVGSQEPLEGARVRKVDPDGAISTVVGGGVCGVDGEREPLSLCDGASDIAVDVEGALYVHDRAADAVWRVGPDGGRTRLPIYLSQVFSLSVSVDGDLYVGRRSGTEPDTYLVQRVSLSVEAPAVAEGAAAWEGRTAGTRALVAGTGDGGFSGDGGPATEAQLADPGRLAAGPDGVVYIADRRNNRVRSIDLDGTIETIAGNGEEAPAPKETAGPAPGDGRLATEVPLWPSGLVGGVAAGPDGSVYLCSEASHRVFRVSPLGVITTFAGTGEQILAGDGGLAVDAALAQPVDVAVGTDGSVYIADHGNDRIRTVDPDGVIATVADLDDPDAVDVAPDGTVYALAGGRIWRVEPSGSVTSITPDDLTDPRDIAVGPDGLLYVSSGAQVFAIQEDGTTKVVADTGDGGELDRGEQRPATDADPPNVDAIALDRAGNLYLSHADANQVTVVVRVTEQPDEVPWHWLVLALVAAVAVVTVALSWWQTRRAGSAPGSATSGPQTGLARP